MFQQHVRTTLSVRLATGFLSKTRIWENRCNHPEDVDSCPHALIHKASIAFKIQTSGRASIRYGNCVHQINRPDDHSLGPDARASDMEIACIRSTAQTTIPLVWTHEDLVWKLLAAEVRSSRRQGNTVQTWLKSGKNFSEILGNRSHSCPSESPMTIVRTAPRFYQARRSFEPAAYK
jgi:hypothetical protein